jgi:UDP-2,3-diacylglucosamine hydrolase
MQCTVFVSDLHLDEKTSQTFMLWQSFVRNIIAQNKLNQSTPVVAASPIGVDTVDALYILGDFFVLWAGDDDMSPFVEKVVATLRALVHEGVKVYLLPGNRDFLLGAKFAERSGCVLLPDPTRIDLYGKPFLLTHGDILCTRDWMMRIFRTITRHRWGRRFFLAFPLQMRQKIAQLVRNMSARARHGNRGDNSCNPSLSQQQLRINQAQQGAEEQAGAQQGKNIIVIDDELVEQLLHTYQAQRMIHGHVHAAGDLPNRIVLDEWLPQRGQALFYRADGSYELQIVSAPS